jgi:hypothetical protein
MSFDYSSLKSEGSKKVDSSKSIMKSSEEMPPEYDISKAVFIRDEKRAAMNEQEDDLLWDNIPDKDDLGPYLYGIIPVKAILLVYTMLMGVAQILMFSFSLESGFSTESLSSLVNSIINISGFSILLLGKSKELMKPFLLIYTSYFLFGSVMSGYAIILLWSPDFCSKLSRMVKGFKFSKCKENLGMIRGVATSMLLAQEIWEFWIIQLYIQVYKYDMKKETIITKEYVKMGEQLV